MAYRETLLLFIFLYKSLSQSFLTSINCNYRQCGRLFHFILPGHCNFIYPVDQTIN
jgi:hypothetical protein